MSFASSSKFCLRRFLISWFCSFQHGWTRTWPICYLARTCKNFAYLFSRISSNNRPVQKTIDICICKISTCIMIYSKNFVFKHSILFKYIRIFRKRPPKMSSLCGRLREVVAYQALVVLVHYFASIACGKFEELPDILNAFFYSCEDSISRKKSGTLLCRTSQQCDNVTTPYCPICALLSVKWLLKGGYKQKKISNFWP